MTDLTSKNPGRLIGSDGDIKRFAGLIGGYMIFEPIEIISQPRMGFKVPRYHYDLRFRYLTDLETGEFVRLIGGS